MQVACGMVETVAPNSGEFRARKECDVHVPCGMVDTEAVMPYVNHLVGLATRVTPALELYIEAIMTLPRVERKLMSYCGALRCPEGVKAHYVDGDTGIGYFDPSNWCYMFGFRVVFRRLSSSYDWNRETMGDLCELLLASGFWRGAEVGQYRLAAWLEDVMLTCYTILTLRPDWIWSHPRDIWEISV